MTKTVSKSRLLFGSWLFVAYAVRVVIENTVIIIIYDDRHHEDEQIL
jgi:hypothetical protein